MSHSDRIGKDRNSTANRYSNKNSGKVSVEEKMEIIRKTLIGESRALIANDHGVAQSSIALWVKQHREALPEIFTSRYNKPKSEEETGEQLKREDLSRQLHRESVTETDIRLERKLKQITSELKQLRQEIRSVLNG